MPNGTTLSANDLTNNGNNGTVFGTPASGVGKIDGGSIIDTLTFQNTQGIDVGSNASLNINTDLTMSVWVKTLTGGMMLGKYQNEGSYAGYGLMISYPTANKVGFYAANDTAVSGWRAVTLTANDGLWHLIITTLSSSVNKKIYFDGVIDFSISTAGSAGSWTGSHIIRNVSNRVGNSFGGIIDEMRISKIARSADWIATEYNNQSSLSAFVYNWPVR